MASKAQISVNQIVGAIPTFTPAEQQQIADALKAAMAMGAAGVRKDEGKATRIVRDEAPEHAREVIAAIISYMQTNRLDRTRTDDALNSTHGREFLKKTPAIWAFFTEHTKGHAARQALLRLAIELLHADLMKMNVATSTRTMMAHAHRLPGIIDNAFPGYAAAGLLSLFSIRKRIHTDDDDGR